VVVTPIPNDASPDIMVKLLHDHSFLITMSPIVTRHAEAGKDPQTGTVVYDVWENITIIPFGLWTHELQFRASFQDHADGVTSWIQAPLGFHSEAKYTIRAAKAGEADAASMVLEESIQTTCPIFFRPFVEMTMVPVRQKMHARIIERAQELQSTGAEASLH